jgi:hypothetical protein
VDELDRPDVQAARRLAGDEQAQRAGQLAREDDLLLVAAGQRPAVDSGPPARMSNSSIRERAFSATGPGL